MDSIDSIFLQFEEYELSLKLVKIFHEIDIEILEAYRGVRKRKSYII